MDKVKVALTVLTVAIVVAPLLGVVYIYRDNLLGLVLPPKINDAKNGGLADLSDLNGIVGSDITAPSISQTQYNPDTGAFSASVNVTNPLTSQISVDHLSANIISKDNNAFLGNVSLTQPINIAPGENALVDIAGNLNQETINQLKAQYSQNGNLNVVLENVDAVVSGVTVHLDRLDIGSLQLPG